MTIPLCHLDITKKITKEDPFEPCKLNRKKYAQILTDSLNISQDGFVLALNNEWGTGKTTFLKMWQAYLESQSFKTLYFNAWENDPEEDVLLSLISEFININKSSNKYFTKLLNCAEPLSMSGLAKVSNAISSGSFDSEAMRVLFSLIGTSISISIENRVKEISQRKKSVTAFKKALEVYVKSKSKKKFVLIVDELDRCKPSYAVKVLETIKHLFVVPGIVFVLGIDKQQLCTAIRGYYGCNSFNAEEYLKRFIDIEYSLPCPASIEFTNYLLDYYKYSEFINSKSRWENTKTKQEVDDFYTFTRSLFTLKNVSLRNQERILGHARLAITSVPVNHYIYPELFIYLIFLRITHNTLYCKIRDSELNIKELIESIDKILPDKIESPDLYIFLLNRLIYMYNLSRGVQKEELFIDNVRFH
jgi:hypothetical protein